MDMKTQQLQWENLLVSKAAIHIACSSVSRPSPNFFVFT